MPVTVLEVICVGCGDIFCALYDESELTVTDEDREMAVAWHEIEENVAEGRVLFDQSFAGGLAAATRGRRQRPRLVLRALL
jgi:hypothetical protein